MAAQIYYWISVDRMDFYESCHEMEVSPERNVFTDWREVYAIVKETPHPDAFVAPYFYAMSFPAGFRPDDLNSEEFFGDLYTDCDCEWAPKEFEDDDTDEYFC